MWFIGVEVEQETSAPPPKKILDPPLKPPGACTWKIALRYKVEQSKNGNFTSNYKASPINFETQISLCR